MTFLQNLATRLSHWQTPRWLRNRWIAVLSSWIVLAALGVLITRYFKHPLFFFMRGVETPLLLTAALLCGWWARRDFAAAMTWRRALEPGLRLALSIALALGVAGQEGWFRLQQYQVLHNGASMSHIGAHFVVGFTDFDEVKPLAERGLIGGIYVTHRNLVGETAASLKAHIDELQARRALAGLPPLFVMADQEGGEVSHLSPLLKPMPALATLVSDTDADLEKRARAYGVEQGRELAEIGINMNLAPVVDLRIPLQGKWLNLHTRIDQRAIAEDPEIVARVATAYGRGLAACGVQPTVKHFPGIGRLRADTHLVQASLQSSPGEQAADWLPFREVTANTGAAMMLSHVRLLDIDAKKPASLSRVVVQEVLRRADGKGWNYQGLLITDDLNMGAVYGEGIGRAAISALNAGVDLILVSYDPDQYYRALFEADKSWRGGGVNEATEADSAARIRRYWHEKRPAACSM